MQLFPLGKKTMLDCKNVRSDCSSYLHCGGPHSFEFAVAVVRPGLLEPTSSGEVGTVADCCVHGWLLTAVHRITISLHSDRHHHLLTRLGYLGQSRYCIIKSVLEVGGRRFIIFPFIKIGPSSWTMLQ